MTVEKQATETSGALPRGGAHLEKVSDVDDEGVGVRSDGDPVGILHQL